jgi:hypothetical protein
MLVAVRPDDATADVGAAPADDAFDDDDDLDDMPDPSEALADGRAALAAGQTGLAAMHLGLVLRLAPALAADVLESLDAETADAPELALVRGDAYRLVGREREARRAYGRARPQAPSPTPIADPRIDPEPDPADAAHGDAGPDPTQGDPT